MERSPRIVVDAVELFEREVRLRLPFRFGIITLTHAPQAFVRVRVRGEDGRSTVGMAAEMLVPKWFDKNPALSHEANIDQLRLALRLAAARSVADRAPRTAFGRFAAHYRAQLDECARHALNPLVASYGPALVDRAVFDALLRRHGLSLFAGLRANLAGIVATDLTPDLAGFDFDRFLARVQPRASIAARHTVGLVDPLTAADLTARLDDGLPETLEEVVATYGHRHYKLKVGGRIDDDLERLRRIAAVLDDGAHAYVVTLDGNEQYDDIDGIAELWSRIEDTPALGRLAAATIYIEQPIQRAAALDRDVARLAARKPLLIDESDSSLEAFAQARALGYTGVSSKACKGFYKSILNAARCAHWSGQGTQRFFLSAEDLTCQAGLVVQQDLALVAALGLDHVERNGHHYVDGFAGASRAEAEAFLAAHPDLYRRDGERVRVRIARGELAIGSLDTPGFGAAAEPDWSALARRAVIEH